MRGTADVASPTDVQVDATQREFHIVRTGADHWSPQDSGNASAGTTGVDHWSPASFREAIIRGASFSNDSSRPPGTLKKFLSVAAISGMALGGVEVTAACAPMTCTTASAVASADAASRPAPTARATGGGSSPTAGETSGSTASPSGGDCSTATDSASATSTMSLLFEDKRTFAGVTTRTGIYGVPGPQNDSATFEELKLKVSNSTKCAQVATLGVEVGPNGTEGHKSVVALPLVSSGQGACTYDSGKISPIDYPSLNEDVRVTALNTGALGLRKSELLKHPGPTTDNWTEPNMPSIGDLPLTIGD